MQGHIQIPFVLQYQMTTLYVYLSNIVTVKYSYCSVICYELSTLLSYAYFDNLYLKLTVRLSVTNEIY